MWRLIKFVKNDPAWFSVIVVAIVVAFSASILGCQGGDSQREERDQENVAVQQGPHENDPGFTLRFTNQPLPKNPTPLEYCEFAVAVDPDLELSFREVTDLRGHHGLEYVDEEITFLDGTRVISRRSGFSNPHGGYRVNHNLRVLRADGTATFAYYGFTDGSACFVSEWREWDDTASGLIEANKASETMYFPDGTTVRITMEPDYTREYPTLSPGDMGYEEQKATGIPSHPGVTLTSASIISSDGVVTDIPVTENITTIRLNTGVRVEIASYDSRAGLFAYE